MATVASRMTTEEMLALPDDGVERWLINGELRERPMTRRSWLHSETMTCVASLLYQWLQRQPQPRGKVLTGDAGVILQRDPDDSFGIDVAYIAPEVSARQSGKSTMIEGIPTPVAEILSPSDTVAEIDEKNSSYLKSGIPLVWILNPKDRTVTVYRPNEEPERFNSKAELSAEPHLPGFRVPVARLFE